MLVIALVGDVLLALFAVEVEVEKQLLHEAVGVFHQHNLVAQQALAVGWVWKFGRLLSLVLFGVSGCTCSAGLSRAGRALQNVRDQRHAGLTFKVLGELGKSEGLVEVCYRDGKFCLGH